MCNAVIYLYITASIKSLLYFMMTPSQCLNSCSRIIYFYISYFNITIIFHMLIIYWFISYVNNQMLYLICYKSIINLHKLVIYYYISYVNNVMLYFICY